MAERVTPLLPGENNTLHDDIVRLIWPVKNIHQTADDIEALIDKEVAKELEHIIKNLRETYKSAVKQGLAGIMKWEIDDSILKLENRLTQLKEK